MLKMMTIVLSLFSFSAFADCASALLAKGVPYWDVKTHCAGVGRHPRKL
jgi:hypothetical protein